MAPNRQTDRPTDTLNLKGCVLRYTYRNARPAVRTPLGVKFGCSYTTTQSNPQESSQLVKQNSNNNNRITKYCAHSMPSSCNSSLFSYFTFAFHGTFPSLVETPPPPASTTTLSLVIASISTRRISISNIIISVAVVVVTTTPLSDRHVLQ